MADHLTILVETKMKLAITEQRLATKELRVKELNEEVERLKTTIEQVTDENHSLQDSFSQLLEEKNTLRQLLEGEAARTKSSEHEDDDCKVAESTPAKADSHWDLVLMQFERWAHTRKLLTMLVKGIPPSLRGDLWIKAVGNHLRITPALFNIMLSRARDRTPEAIIKDGDGTQLIPLDLMRTLNTLQLFQKDQTLHQSLLDVLNVFAIFRPDVGYVQGMAYLNAVLLLHLSPVRAFIVFSNLLCKSKVLYSFYTFDIATMHTYYKVFESLLDKRAPRILQQFRDLGITPDMYLLEWVYTLFARCFSLDVLANLWDYLFAEGDVALLKVAVANLCAMEKDLVSGDLEDIMRLLNSSPARFPDFKSLWKQIKKVKLTTDRIDVLRERVNGRV
mmetsp:Transcript_34749/g.61146  ORF Transcript_34749/g.61146 Transcript_34749/m.61146 type:complete len:391 (+) Transcript_34749:912-2084(+)